MEDLRSSAESAGGALLLITKTGSIKPLFRINSYNFNSYYSPHNRRSFVGTITAEITRNSRRDSNAETVKSPKFKFKFRGKNTIYGDNEGSGGTGKGERGRWWSDESRFAEDEEASNLLEEFIDSLWILKLSKFYGWTLPLMIISSLIATGLKTFLVALSLSVGQSVLSFAFQKLSGTTRSKPRPRRRARKRRKRPFVTYPGDVGRVEKEEEKQENVEGNGVPRSWGVNDDRSVKNEKTEAATFGGWDELDGMDSIQRRRPRKVAPERKKPSTGGNGKLGRRREESDAPLLLRLLIAVFPFLASWTKML